MEGEWGCRAGLEQWKEEWAIRLAWSYSIDSVLLQLLESVSRQPEDEDCSDANQHYNKNKNRYPDKLPCKAPQLTIFTVHHVLIFHQITSLGLASDPQGKTAPNISMLASLM